MNSSKFGSESKCSLYIDLNIIKENYNTLRAECKNAEVGAVVKANAYGLGVAGIAPILERSGCNHFFVSSCDEGITLRKILGLNNNIYVLQGVFKNELEAFKENNLIPVLNHLGQVELWQQYASTIARKLPCFIHIDTAMHRLGMLYDEIDLLNLDDIKNLDILCVMSHLASAEDIENSSNQHQLVQFNQYASKFGKVKKSLANSSGIFLGEEYHFDLTRPGAAIYGINPTPYLQESHIKNPVKLLAPIVMFSDLSPLASIGYNGTFTNTSNHNIRVATIPIGYADGFPRLLSNKASVYIDDIEVPVIGRVSMDLTTIDVSSVPDSSIFLGKQVEIIGKNSTPDKLAKFCNTNSYEILTMLGYRHKRIYSE